MIARPRIETQLLEVHKYCKMWGYKFIIKTGEGGHAQWRMVESDTGYVVARSCWLPTVAQAIADAWSKMWAGRKVRVRG